VAVEWRGARGSGVTSSRIGLSWLVPATEQLALSIAVERELAGSTQRAFGTRATIAVILPGAPREAASGTAVAK
jgi:hypothetical protein